MKFASLTALERRLHPPPRRRGGVPTIALGVLWLAAVAAGFTAAIVHEQTPAPDHRVVIRWPDGATCAPPQSRPLLIVFVHPKCPCTRASLDEIARLHGVCGDQLDMQFVFLQRGDAPWRSEDTDHWETVRKINAGPAFVDVDGVEHRRFGATTSGEVFLYLPTGELAFHGGVTVARGHVGKSAGSAAIEAVVASSATSIRQTAVFGCPLESPSQAAQACGRNPAVSVR
jgi:hypothetical protein